MFGAAMHGARDRGGPTTDSRLEFRGGTAAGRSAFGALMEFEEGAELAFERGCGVEAISTAVH
jgi:hypothetical protein